MKTPRRWVSVLVGIIWALTLTSSPAYALGVDDAINQVNLEYSNGQITDKAVRDNLLLMLNDAKIALDPDEFDALVEAFRIMVWAQAGDKITDEAADRILSQVTGL